MTLHVSPLVRRCAALGLALALLSAAASVTVVPVGDYLAGLERAIAAARDELQRVQRLAAAVTDREADGSVDQLLARSFLPGESETIQRAALLTLLKKHASETGIRVLSTTSTPVTARDGFRLAGVQVVVRGPISNLHRFLHRIEAGTPRTLVDQLDMRPIQDPSEESEPRTLNVDIRVLGLLRREAERS